MKQEYPEKKLAHFMNMVIKLNFMNKNLLIASAITAGTLALFYVLKRRRSISQPVTEIPAEHSRHLTNVFSKAKHN
jgi:hypothetical protein